MESDAYLEFKWKGDTFFIVLFFPPLLVFMWHLHRLALGFRRFQMDSGGGGGRRHTRTGELEVERGQEKKAI